jgi:hypothetical protein
MNDFVKTVRDKEKGKHYRLYAGINNVNLPCEATFTNLKDRCWVKGYTIYPVRKSAQNSVP